MKFHMEIIVFVFILLTCAQSSTASTPKRSRKKRTGISGVIDMFNRRDEDAERTALELRGPNKRRMRQKATGSSKSLKERLLILHNELNPEGAKDRVQKIKRRENGKSHVLREKTNPKKLTMQQLQTGRNVWNTLSNDENVKANAEERRKKTRAEIAECMKNTKITKQSSPWGKRKRNGVKQYNPADLLNNHNDITKPKSKTKRSRLPKLAKDQKVKHWNVRLRTKVDATDRNQVQDLEVTKATEARSYFKDNKPKGNPWAEVKLRKPRTGRSSRTR